MTTKGCETCRWFLRCDYGYSNWTVEGTNGDCLKGVNPHLPADLDAYGSDKGKTERALAFGESCAQRVQGDGAWFDVDGDTTNDAYKDEPDLYAALLEYDKRRASTRSVHGLGNDTASRTQSWPPRDRY